MKKSRFLLLLLTFLFLFSLFPSVFVSAASFPELTAPSAFLIHPESGLVLFEREADQKRYPASITKVTTALIIVEAIAAGEIGAEDVVTASSTFEVDLEADGSSQGIRPGEKMTVNDLLHCVIIASANEACNILAEYYAGSIENFVALMNEHAAALNCTGTHYANTHGLHNDQHYTPARDIAVIAAEAMKYDLFMELVGASIYTVPATNLSDARYLTNTNMLISGQLDNYYTYEPCLGGKTGRTSKAGNCLVSYAEQDGVRLISVVLNTGYTEIPEHGTSAALSFSETRALFEWGFSNYSYRTVVDSGDMVAEAQVTDGRDVDFVVVHPAEDIRYFLPNSFDLAQFHTVVRLASAEGVKAPVAEGQVLGALDLYQGDKYLCSVDVVALNSVDGIHGAALTYPEAEDSPSEDPSGGEEPGSSVNWIRTAVIIFLAVVVFLLLLYLILLFINARRRAAYRKQKAKRVHK